MLTKTLFNFFQKKCCVNIFRKINCHSEQSEESRSFANAQDDKMCRRRAGGGGMEEFLFMNSVQKSQMN